MTETNPTPTQPETLETCPFCPDGGDPYLHDMQFGTRAHDVAVRCRKCGASANSYSWASGLTHLQDERYAEARRKAVVAWNTRRAAVTGPRGDDLLSQMWQALIRETCINPTTAKTVVFLGEEKFRKALAPFVKSPTPAERKFKYDQIDLAGLAEVFEEDDRYQALPLKWFVKPSPPRGYYIYEGSTERDEREAVVYVDAWSIADTIAEKHNARLATPAPADNDAESLRRVELPSPAQQALQIVTAWRAVVGGDDLLIHYIKQAIEENRTTTTNGDR